MQLHRISAISEGPVAAGPYSLGVFGEGKFLHVSGQGPYDPALGRFVRGSVAEQTELTLQNVRKIIEAAGGSLENVVSCRVFLQQLTEANFREMNEVYARFFGEHKPARTTIGCQLLNIDVEIDAVVLL
jgi:2-iminobutanoate/2-iminopropanoate deaminase